MKGTLGLVSEAGELAGIVEKVFYQDRRDLTMMEIFKELGDVLWYLAYTCNACGVTLREIASLNYEKLSARYPKGKFDAEDSKARVDGG